MTQTAITIIGSLDKAAENRALETARAVAGVSVQPVILAAGGAVDILLPAHSAELTERLRRAFDGFGSFDVFVQPQDEFRRKKLLVADMDATMVEGETLDELAARAGVKDKVAAITDAAMRGEIDFAEALRQRVALLRGLPAAALAETLAEVRPSKGAAVLVRTMARHGAHGVLVSGGFDFFTRAIAAQLGFHENVGNRLGIEGDRLTGEVMPPIVDKDVKKRTLEETARARQIDLRATLAVGDGANDIPMLQAAGAGVGYFGKPAVLTATPHHIRHTDLTSLLFMQGYRAAEFAA